MSDPSISIHSCFAGRRAQGRGVLIPYLTAGYPDAGSSLNLMGRLAEAGADIIELGLPFSDPLADGPTIQRTSFRALAEGMTAAGALELLRRFRDTHSTPVVLFTYLNPVLAYGVDGFLSEASSAGAQGLLITDLPTGADPELEALLSDSALDLIRLIAPTTPLQRVAAVARGGSGFLYYISRTGVTGAQEELRDGLGAEVESIRGEVSLPIAVGFGISTPAQARAVAEVADGVVVGSALLNAMDEGGVKGAAAFLRGLREGMDGTG